MTTGDGGADARVMLSKLQENSFQIKKAYENHQLAKSIDPNARSVLENEAHWLLNLGEFERSIFKYHEAAQRVAHPNDFVTGKLTVLNTSRSLYPVSLCPSPFIEIRAGQDVPRRFTIHSDIF